MTERLVPPTLQAMTKAEQRVLRAAVRHARVLARNGWTGTTDSESALLRAVATLIAERKRNQRKGK